MVAGFESSEVRALRQVASNHREHVLRHTAVRVQVRVGGGGVLVADEVAGAQDVAAHLD
jgi:hypothetical protein